MLPTFCGLSISRLTWSGRPLMGSGRPSKNRPVRNYSTRTIHLPLMMKGHFAYFAVPTNTHLLSAFRYHTSIIWFRSLRRRSQRHRLTWERMVVQQFDLEFSLHIYSIVVFCVPAVDLGR
jgi:hypothetical protein